MSQAATVDNVYVAQNDDDFQEAPLSQNGEIMRSRLLTTSQKFNSLV